MSPVAEYPGTQYHPRPGYFRGVLRVKSPRSRVVWRCDHRHELKAQALDCATRVAAVRITHSAAAATSALIAAYQGRR